MTWGHTPAREPELDADSGNSVTLQGQAGWSGGKKDGTRTRLAHWSPEREPDPRQVPDILAWTVRVRRGKQHGRLGAMPAKTVGCCSWWGAVSSSVVPTIKCIKEGAGPRAAHFPSIHSATAWFWRKLETYRPQ